MTGFQNRPTTDLTADLNGGSALRPPAETQLDRTTIENVVKRAQRLRSEQFGIWLKHCFANWRSLWRRPGRAIPKTYKSFKANA